MSTPPPGPPVEGSGSVQEDAPAPTDADWTVEDVAMFLVTTFIQNAAGAAVGIVEQTAAAVEDSLGAALRGEYSASRLAKDSALLWARNVEFVSRLFSVGSPTEALAPAQKPEKVW
jgi:hypothetical protein